MRPVHRHARLPRHPEPPCHVGAGADAHPRPGPHAGKSGGRPRSRPDTKRRGRHAHVRPVERTVDTEGLAEPGRAPGQVARRERNGTPLAAGTGQLLPLDHGAGPEQDRGRGARGQAHHVHAEVHAVCEINISVPGRTEHHRVPRRLSAVRVRRGISLPQVRLHLGQLNRDQPGVGLVLQHAAEQLRGDLEGRPVEEVARYDGHGAAANAPPLPRRPAPAR